MKYKAVFLRKVSEYQKIDIVKREQQENKKTKKSKTTTIKSTRPNYIRVGSKKFSPLDETIVFDKDNSYPVQLDGYSFQEKDTLIYYYDYDTGELIGLETLLKYKIMPKDLNKVTGKKIVEQIVAGAKTVAGNPLIYIILPLITGFAGIITGYWMGGGFG